MFTSRPCFALNVKSINEQKKKRGVLNSLVLDSSEDVVLSEEAHRSILFSLSLLVTIALSRALSPSAASIIFLDTRLSLPSGRVCDQWAFSLRLFAFILHFLLAC